jgi:ankyrin repeat protein
MPTAAQNAIARGNLEDLRSDIRLSGDPDQPDKDGRPLLVWAILEGNNEAVALLIENGAEVNLVENRHGYSPIHFAAQGQNPEAIAMLVNAGAELESKDKFGNTALNRAVFDSKGRGETITELLRHGADPNIQNNYNITPHSLAKQIANYDIAQFFK